MTLRDKLRDAARGVRELAEHLELGFVPKVHDLRKLARQHEVDSTTPPVEDVTIRSHVSTVLDSDQFTAKLNDSLVNYLNSIQKDVSEIVGGGNRR